MVSFSFSPKLIHYIDPLEIQRLLRHEAREETAQVLFIPRNP